MKRGRAYWAMYAEFMLVNASIALLLAREFRLPFPWSLLLLFPFTFAAGFLTTVYFDEVAA